MKAIILAGGKGTRLLPLTEFIPKALITIGHTTLIEQILENLPDAITEVIVTTKHLGELIEQKLGNTYRDKSISYAKQSSDIGGTWGAVFGAKDYIRSGESFLVLNCDDLFTKEELEKIIESKKIGMGVTKTVMPAKYHGIIASTDGLFSDFKRHTNIERETLVEDDFANGLYLLDEKIFSFEPIKLTDGEYGLPQTLLAQKESYPLFIYRMNHWQPYNSHEDIARHA